MPQFSDPLVAIINPPDIQSGMPGDVLTLSVVLQNQGEYGAVIDVFLDDAEQIPRQWCRVARQRLALDPQQSGELVFDFETNNEDHKTYDFSLFLHFEALPLDSPYEWIKSTRLSFLPIRGGNTSS